MLEVNSVKITNSLFFTILSKESVSALGLKGLIKILVITFWQTLIILNLFFGCVFLVKAMIGINLEKVLFFSSFLNSLRKVKAESFGKSRFKIIISILLGK